MLFRLTIAIGLLSFLTSCRFDTIIVNSPTTSENEIVLFIPATESVEVRSTPTSSECYIYNAAVLIVDNSNTVTAAEYVTSISNNGTQSPSLRLTSLTPSSGDNIVVVCNFDTSVDASTVAQLEDSPLTTAQNTLQGKAAYTSNDTNDTATLEPPLLMYGSGNYGSTLSVTFQVAKITVELDSSASSNLDIKSFFTYGSAPNTTWGGSSQTSDGAHKMSATLGENMYIYDNTSYSTALSKSSGNYIILEVTNPASEVDDGVSVAEGSTGYICLAHDTYFQRGSHYNFKITNLYSRGYDSIEEAMANPGNVEYNVIITDDWSTDYQYNGQYAIATAVDTAYIQFTATLADLVQIGTYLSSSAQNNITTRTASLVRINGNTFTQVTKNDSGIILTDSQGTTASEGNVLTIPESIDENYTLQYTTSGNIVQGMYLRIRYGNLEKFITVPTVSFSYDEIGDVSSGGGTFNLNVTKTVWNPNEATYTTSNYSNFTITVDDAASSWITAGDGSVTVNSRLDFGDEVDNVNLATENGFDRTETTANCYIVNSPGTYYFPLVYGNARKNGSNNTEAYTKASGTATGLNNFVNSKGNTITQPYIYVDYTPTNAFVVWQDSENMITNVGLDSDRQNLTFTVPSPIASEGNAILAVADADGIIWSWHIWVTLYDPYDTSNLTLVNNYNKAFYYVMTKYLGNCSTMDLDDRSGTVQIIPDDIDAPGFSITITQGAVTQIGDVCYYQSGRKDPFPGMHRIANNSPGEGEAYAAADFRNKETYGTYSWPTGSTSPGEYVGELSKQEEIQQPYKLNSSTNHSSLRGFNYWNSSLSSRPSSFSVSDDVVTKTVYDPCPPDFCVPPIGLFGAFFSSSYTGNSFVQMNVDNTSETDETLYINLPSGSSPSTYDLTVVPFRDLSATDPGSIRTSVAFSIFSSTPSLANYHTLSIIGQYDDYRKAHLNNGNIPYQARSVLPVREPNNSSWTTY